MDNKITKKTKINERRKSMENRIRALEVEVNDRNKDISGIKDIIDKIKARYLVQLKYNELQRLVDDYTKEFLVVKI